MRKIKVLHLTSTPCGIGGVERLLLDMAPHYDRERFSVAHCNLFDETEGKGPFPRGLEATGLPCFEITGNHWHDVPRLARAVRRLVKSEQVDVLHLHMVRATVVGGLATWLGRRARVLVSKHHLYSNLSSDFAGRLDRAFTSGADAIAAVSRSVKDDLVRQGTPAAKINVVHNGIDLADFDRRSMEEPPLPLGKDPGPVLACFGSLQPRKGHEFAIRAMPEITRSYPTARLLIVGEGPRRSALEQLAKSLGVGASVSMLGFQANVPAIIPKIDVCVHPSLDEPFGIALLEAMAGRKPTVATDFGGIPEIISEGVTGMLVPPREPSAIAGAVCTILSNAILQKRLGTAARARVEQEFTIQKTVGSYETLYCGLARLAGARAPTLNSPQ